MTTALGVRLILCVGENLPRPASFETMAAVRQVQVNTSDETGDGFQITLSLAKGKLQEYTLLDSGDLALFNRVVIAVAFGVMPEVLIDGVITNRQIAPGDEPGMATLTVTGTDITKMMDLEETNAPYENQSSSMMVMQILGNYAKYGIIPQVTQTSDMKMGVEGVKWQGETDLECIRRLAAEQGYVFYVEPKTIGSSVAYWGPKVRAGALQPALSVGTGGSANVTGLSISEEGLAASSVKGSFIESNSKTTVAIPSVPPLRMPPLVSRPTPARKVTYLRDTANKGAGEAFQAVMSAVTNQPDTVDGSGELDGARYGHVLRARRLVGVRGAGDACNGVYYVRSVSHRISRGEYRQSFSLTREGTGAIIPMVMP